MLRDFFRLNGPYVTLDEAALVSELRESKDIFAVLYKPDAWPDGLKKVSGVLFRNTSFSKTEIQRVTFSRCTFIDCLFIGTNFREVEFHGCIFNDCNMYKSTFNECYIDPTSFIFSGAVRNRTSNVSVHLYQQLYENASKTKQDTFARFADIAFRRSKRKQIAYDVSAGKMTRSQGRTSFFWSATYDTVAGFGYSPTRFIAFTLVMFCVISTLNMHIFAGAMTYANETLHTIDMWNAIYYSFSVLTVLGFSSIVPDLWYAKVVTVLEALFGVGWLGLFTSVLVKRIIR